MHISIHVFMPTLVLKTSDQYNEVVY